VECAARFWRSLPALVTPFIIVGGILLGWFTATESACVAVLYPWRCRRSFTGNRCEGALQGFARPGRLAGSPCLRRHGQRLRLVAGRTIQDSEHCWPNVSTWGMGDCGGLFIAFCFLVVGCFLDAIRPS